MLNTDIAMGLARVTEAAALSASKFMGRGDKTQQIKQQWMVCTKLFK